MEVELGSDDDRLLHGLTATFHMCRADAHMHGLEFLVIRLDSALIEIFL